MATNFEFAFLGSEHSYLTSLTHVLASGHPSGPSRIIEFRLPQPFTERLRRLRTRYVSDVRGHDFLSHTGRWTDGNNQGIVDATTASLTEIEGLKSLARENRRRGYDEADMKVSLGPDQGSYFADTYRLGRYHYDQLPKGLNFEVQRDSKYGKITDVAMNGAGGWVMQFDVGDLKMALSKFLGKKKGFEHYRFGGELPAALKEALRQGQVRGAKIMHMFLNHQNGDEYLLFLSDGQVFACLHGEFRGPFQELLETWGVERGSKFNLHWESSCWCTAEQQAVQDAAYYNLRGLFHLSRNNPELALAYFREAIVQASTLEITYNHRLALEAVRLKRNDQILERRLDMAYKGGRRPADFINYQDLSSEGVFRNQYLSLVRSPQECEDLARQLQRFIPTEQSQQPYPEWSFPSSRKTERRTLHEMEASSPSQPSHFRVSQAFSEYSQGRESATPLTPTSVGAETMELEASSPIARQSSYELSG